MTRRERVLTGKLVSEHIVQLFDCEESRADGVAAFVRDGLSKGTRAIVVARPRNWSCIGQELRDRGVGVADAIATGALTVLDAGELLASFMRGERPDPALFRRQVGAVVAKIAAGSEEPISVYGEMVDLLAETGDFLAAAELEHLWNGLLQKHAVTLLCGYCSAHFGPEPASAALLAICRAHTNVRTGADDSLGGWLTAAVWPTATR